MEGREEGIDGGKARGREGNRGGGERKNERAAWREPGRGGGIGAEAQVCKDAMKNGCSNVSCEMYFSFFSFFLPGGNVRTLLFTPPLLPPPSLCTYGSICISRSQSAHRISRSRRPVLQLSNSFIML